MAVLFGACDIDITHQWPQVRWCEIGWSAVSCFDIALGCNFRFHARPDLKIESLVSCIRSCDFVFLRCGVKIVDFEKQGFISKRLRAKRLRGPIYNLPKQVNCLIVCTYLACWSKRSGPDPSDVWIFGKSGLSSQTVWEVMFLERFDLRYWGIVNLVLQHRFLNKRCRETGQICASFE